jgi:hypothetical protein
MHSRRALLYMPGDNWKMITKSITLGVDSICMDMEDGTAINKKAEARETIAKALRELDFGASEKLARINSVGSGWEQEDIEAVLPFHPDGIVIPKVESFEQVEWASRIIETAELKHGWPVNSVRVLIGVETAKGILNLKEIAAHPRLVARILPHPLVRFARRKRLSYCTRGRRWLWLARRLIFSLLILSQLITRISKPCESNLNSARGLDSSASRSSTLRK